VAFVGCPSDIDIFEADATNSPTVKAWAEPSLLPELVGVLELATAGKTSDNAYPFGTTTIAYSSHVATDHGTPMCAFDIRVRAGFSTQLDTVGALTVASDSLYFLIDGHGSTPALHFMPAFRAKAMQPLVASFSTDSGLPFSIDVPEGMHAQMFVSLSWCEAGVIGDPSTLAKGGAAGIELVSQSADDVVYVNSITFTDGGSGYYGSAVGGDLSCFRMDLNSSIITRDMRLRRINVVYTSQVLPGESDPEFVYNFNPATSVFVRFSPTTAGAFLVSGARLVIDDVDPPVWQGCPLEPITVKAAVYADGATAIWVPPIAVDEVTNVIMEQTHAPGDYFTILGSPHTVVYTAFDDNGFSSTCAILVAVEYERDTTTTYGVLSTEFAQSVTYDPVVRYFTIVQNLATHTSPAQSTFDPAFSTLSLDLSIHTAIALTMALPDGSVLVRVRDSARAQVIEIDLTWTSDGLPFKGASDAKFNAFPTFSFKDFAPTGSTSRRRRAVDASFGTIADTTLQASDNEFASFEAVVDTDNGVIRLKAASHPINEGFTFTAFTINLGYPSGAVDSVPATYRLADGSFVNVKAIYDTEPDPVEVGYFVALLDVEPPVIHDCPSTFGEVTLPGLDYTFAKWTEPTFTDNVGILKTVMSRRSGSQFDLLKVDQESEVVTVHAWDLNGNSASCNFAVIVEDAESPTVECAADITRTLALGASTVRITPTQYAPQNVSDNSRWPVTVTSPTSAVFLGPGMHSVKVVVRDNWKRRASCFVQVTVIDDQLPTITCPELNAVSADIGASSATVKWSAPVTADNDVVAQVVATPTSGSDFPLGDTVVTLTAVDASGNNVSCTFVVTVLAQADPLASTADSSTPVGVIAGSAGAGGLILIVVVILAIALNRQRQRAKAPQNWDEIFSLMEQFNNADGEDGPSMPREISRDAVKLVDELGKGAFGLVSKGVLKESSLPGYLVAVKSLLPGTAASDRRELLEESAVMAQFSHPNVTQLIGVVTAGKPLLAILEYCEHGSLKSYLEDNPNIGLVTQLLFCLDSCRGLAHVHQKGFVHRDVAARNVLISSEGRGKIADFGLSRETDEDSAYYKSRGGQLPVRWTAPEALEDRKFGEKSDVWSFGILVHEIFTQAALPYLGMNNQRVWIDVLAGYRLPQANGCPDAVYDMMLRCWKEDPKDRPTFAQLGKFFGEQYTNTSGLPLPDGEIALKVEEKKRDSLYSGIMKKFRSSLSRRSSTASTGSSEVMYNNASPGMSETALAFKKNNKGFEVTSEGMEGGANYDIASALTGTADEFGFGEEPDMEANLEEDSGGTAQILEVCMQPH